MPHNWQMMDSNFPTITGEEPVKEQIGKIIDYLSILTEQLQYQLQNLDSSNWNASALTQLEESAVKRLGDLITNLQNRVDTVAGRINAAEGIVGRVKTAEEQITDMDLALDALLAMIGVTADGATIGAEGKVLHLNGTVYINGVLQGESAEPEAPEVEEEV